jgi:Cdc6-like AAA superfamily ATPase
MSEPPPDRPFLNPFSLMAVARISDEAEQSGSGDITVQTSAIRQATGYVADYFQSSRDGQSSAEVLLILGDYGSGKTHLARQLVRTATELSDDPSQTLHIEASAENLLRTYQRLLDKLGLDRIRARVNDFYADVVAEELDTGLADDMVEVVRNRQIDPNEVVSDRNLRESALLRKVKQQLLVVTRQESFVDVLALLLRNGFDDAVWSWLGGAEPDQILVERGITSRIASTVDLFEAMGVFALLFGGRNRRFLLVIDEFDQIFSQARAVGDSVMTGFQRMLEVFANAGACLVLCGHPDFLTMIGPASLARITHRIEVPGLNVEQAIEFIVRAQTVELRESRLWPFTEDTVAYMVSLTGGNARQFIRMCHRLYHQHHMAAEAGGPETSIEPGMVSDVARLQFGALSDDDIVTLTKQILTAGGWRYLPRYRLGQTTDTRVDFWIMFEDRIGGCAVLITGSLLEDSDVDSLRRRIAAIRDAATDIAIIVVVNGVLGARPEARLQDLLDAEPLIFASRTFRDDLAALISGIGARLPVAREIDALGSVSQRIEQLARQQSAVYALIEQLGDDVGRARAATETQITTLHRDVTSLVRGDDDTADAPGAGLPDDVRRLFTDVLDTLTELTRLGLMMDQALEPGQDEIIAAVQRRVSSLTYREAVGIATLLQHAVTAFQNRILRWYVSNGLFSSVNPLTRRAEDELEDICRTYDAIVEFLPPFGMDTLLSMPSWQGSRPDADVKRQDRSRALLDTVESLGPRVREATRRSLPAAEGLYRDRDR